MCTKVANMNSLYNLLASTPQSKLVPDQAMYGRVSDSIMQQHLLRRKCMDQKRCVADAWVDWNPPDKPNAKPVRRNLTMIAAFTGQIEVLEYLLANGADPNARSPDDGYTALHCAAEGGSSRSVEAISVLIRCGGDFSVLDFVGRRPIDLLCQLLQLPTTAVSQPALDLTTPAASLSNDSELDKPEFQTDDFRMFGFKVAKCPKAKAHDWTECPYAHPGEKARRRDPRKFVYCAEACPDFRKGSCKRGDGCQYAHGVFECWLHPLRYRTQMCKDGIACTRKVCFFAHTAEQLRVTEESANPAPSSVCSGEGDATSCSSECASERCPSRSSTASPLDLKRLSLSSVEGSVSCPDMGSPVELRTPSPREEKKSLVSPASTASTLAVLLEQLQASRGSPVPCSVPGSDLSGSSGLEQLSVLGEQQTSSMRGAQSLYGGFSPLVPKPNTDLMSLGFDVFGQQDIFAVSDQGRNLSLLPNTWVQQYTTDDALWGYKQQIQSMQMAGVRNFL